MQLTLLSSLLSIFSTCRALAVAHPGDPSGYNALDSGVSISLLSGYSPPVRHDDTFTPDFVLVVTYQNVSIGCQSRTSVVINGSTPGPAIRLPAGKSSWIRVYNEMDEFNFTMHWHGLAQRTAVFSDGSIVSQWPIAPHHFFDYEVHPEPEDAGSYFYHSHVGFQAVTAAGPLIVEDPGEPPYAYDEERIIMFTDYFNKTDTAIEEGLIAKPFKWSGETNAVLINGVGVSIGEKAGRGDCKLPVIDVEPDTTYRLRFIGALALSMVQFAIVDHAQFTIVGADGQYTLPHQECFMQVSSGQRFEVIFRTKTEAELGDQRDFLIQYETKDRPAVYRGYGVLRYSDAAPSITEAPTTPPLNLTNPTYTWLEYTLEPLRPNNFPTAEEVTRRITIYDRQVPTESIIWQLNSSQWNDSTQEAVQPARGTPYLIDIYERGQAAIPSYEAAQENGGWDPKSYTWPARIGEVLEIIWYNTGSLVHGGVDYHPFHAHGGHYYDIGSGNGSYDPIANEEKLKNYNPVLRDTTNLYAYTKKTDKGRTLGWRAWRLRVEDAGVWMIHCHILQHMVMGMQSVWVMGDADQIKTVPEPYIEGYLAFAYIKASHFNLSMTASSFPRLVALGNGVWLDEIRKEGEQPIMDVPGGSVTFATLGARLFCPFGTRSIGMVFNAGRDFPPKVLDLFRQWSITLTVNHSSDQPSSRGLVFYSRANSNRKGFQRLTEPLPVVVRDLEDSPLLHSLAFHFFGTAEYVNEQKRDLDSLGQQHEHLNPRPRRPLVVWEPHAKSCRPDTLLQHLDAARGVDVFSPNHEELASFFEEDTPHASDKATIVRQARVFLNSGIGSKGDGCVLIRCAEEGCVVLTTETEPVWLPAFYAKDASKVMDPTGGGNGFLGAFIVGYQETGSVVEAAKYGHVGASFMIEQIGCPELTGEGEDERWNGCSVSGRLADYRAMLSS
ncbi:L-ascorbate oxidase [Teratosphaeria destructans]|uniref:L-ascorbate oxidase n=1 Tax=Teratosphaeria destructans TaxID=418781 RepID=A0A9W7STJ8_9PEZI|nr:L-ascorbate oxidase [Teratosphaeria destructans]